MEVVKIEKYIPEDHQEVNRIYDEGIKEHVKRAIPIGLKHPRIQTLLGLAFGFGYYHSWACAVLYLVCALLMQSFCVFACFYGYVWFLATDMKDTKLKFWTSPPNVFLVAKMNGRVVGCGSYQQIGPDTVEMNRIAVDSNRRGQRIGRKLVEALNNTAKNQGYTTMYVETSNAQIDATKMYEKMGFAWLRPTGWFGPDWLSFLVASYFSGLYSSAYIRRL